MVCVCVHYAQLELKTYFSFVYIFAYMLINTICPNLKTVKSLKKNLKKAIIRTGQVGHTVGVDFKLITFQMLADESQQSVQDSHGPRNRGG